MAYYDSYNRRTSQTAYPPQQYADQAEPSFNPYDNTQPHQTYEQAGYGYQDNGGFGEYRDEPAEPSGSTPQVKAEKNPYENNTYVSQARTEPKCVPNAVVHSAHPIE